MNMLKLKTPNGIVYIRNDSVVALLPNPTGISGAAGNTLLWVDGMEEPFNIQEDCDAVLAMLPPESYTILQNP